MLSDRRDAVRGIKSLAKSYRREIAELCLDPLIQCLCTDRNDHEVMSLCLEALVGIFSDADDSFQQQMDEVELSVYAEKLTKDDVFSTILACLEENDFNIRFPAIRLLTSLLQLKSRELQQLVLLNPTAVARFMDLLSDVREVIRNDVLVLLNHLTRGNSSIQKIVVFENVFEKLFSIMNSEGYGDGGIVTQDCLILLLSLIAGNSANQLLFREGSFIQHLVAFFDSLPSNPNSVQKTWSPEKTDNFVLLFQLIRHLVTPGSGIQQIQTVQKIANQCGLLLKTAELLSESGLPPVVLIEALGVVGELSRDFVQSQDLVIQMNVPAMRPARSLLVVLLQTLTNDKQPLNLRLAILYCVQCLLFKNKQAQMSIIKGLNSDSLGESAIPDSILAMSTSAGQLIVSGLMALDSASPWLSSGVLISALGQGQESEDLRSELLKAQLSLSLAAQSVPLLQQITSTLAMQKLRLSTKAGLLQLLCVWLSYSPVAVDNLLADSPSIACLLSQISQPPGDNDEAVVRSLSAFAIGLCILFNQQTDPSMEYNREKLVMIVRRRIGIETFADALTVIASNDDYARCLRSPRPQCLTLQISTGGREEVDQLYSVTKLPLFTHEFCLTYRLLERDVVNALTVTHQQQTSSNHYRNSPAVVEASNGEWQNRIASLEHVLADRNAECDRLKRELGTYKMAVDDSNNEYRSVLAEKDRAIGQLQAELMAARSFVQYRGNETNSSECVGHVNEIEKLKNELSSLRQEQDDLLLLLSHQDSRLARLRDKLASVGMVDSELEDDDDDDEDEDDGNDEAASGPSEKKKSPHQEPPSLGDQKHEEPPPSQPLNQQVEQPSVNGNSFAQTTSNYFANGQYQNGVAMYTPVAYPQQQQQQQQQPNYYQPQEYEQQQQQQGYPYPQQQYYPYPQYQQQQNEGNLSNYFGQAMNIGESTTTSNDGSDSAATSDSQNSQIRIQ